MATWSIEHIPASGGASTFASLGVWGFASLQMQFVNWGIDQAAVTTRGGSIAFEAAQFAYLDKLVVWRNGARFAHFWITGLGLSADQFESRTYTLSGPAWWLNQYAPGDTSNVTLYTAGAYIALGMGAAIAAGAPVGCDSGVSSALNIGCPDVRSAGTVLALVQEAARHVPFSSGWWDCSGETPILHASRRSALSTVTLALGTAAVETFGLTIIPEMQLKSVRIRFGWTGGASYYYDTAGTSSDLSGPNHLQCTLNYGTQAAALEAARCGVAEKVFADMSTLPWGGTVNLHATDSVDITPVHPGSALNLTGGLSEWSTMGALVQSVVWSVSPEANDCCTLQLGAPDHLGIQDYFSLSASVGSASGAESPTPPVDPLDPTPGTYDDLNGGTGGGTPEGIIAVQSRGGTWSLVGFSALDGTEPLRRWRTQTWSGTKCLSGSASSESVFPESCCGDARISAKKWVLSGADTYSATTGAYTEGATVALYDGSDGGGSCDTVALTSTSHPTALPQASYDIHTISATVETRVGYGCTGYLDGHVPDNPGCVNSWWDTCEGTVSRTLSAEDFEADAIGRMLATAEWGSATTAIRTIRTTGITGIYRELRYRTEHTAGDPAVTVPTLIGLSPWQRYQVTVTLESRPVDSAGAPTGDGSWSAAGTRQHYFIADITGEGGIDWQVVEPTAGYETRVASTLVEVA